MKKQRHDDPKEDSFFGTSFIIYLVLAAIAMLFLGAMGAYMYNRVLFDIPAIQIPGIFYVSTVVAIIISILCSRTVRAFKDNNFNAVITQWSVIIIAVLVFMTLQIYGWYTLIESGLPASQNNSMGYLYVLSALHLFHILVGLPFHILILWKQYTAYQTDDFEKIEYIAQRKNKEHLILMSRYWHFLDGLWVVLMVFFLLNSMQKFGTMAGWRIGAWAYWPVSYEYQIGGLLLLLLVIPPSHKAMVEAVSYSVDGISIQA